MHIRTMKAKQINRDRDGKPFLEVIDVQALIQADWGEEKVWILYRPRKSLFSSGAAWRPFKPWDPDKEVPRIV